MIFESGGADEMSPTDLQNYPAIAEMLFKRNLLYNTILNPHVRSKFSIRVHDSSILYHDRGHFLRHNRKANGFDS